MVNMLHFSTGDVDSGAAKASYRLHSALRSAGVTSKMIVRHKMSNDDDVQGVLPISRWQSRTRRVKSRIPIFEESLTRLPYWFNYDIEPDVDTTILFSRSPDAVDVICLHDLTGLLNVKGIKRLHDYYHCPIIWLLMDQEPVTGGCHYSWDCSGFTKQCGCCPVLQSTREHDRSRTVWLRKHEYLQHLPITLVAASDWVADRIRESSLFGDHPVAHIPAALDTSIFRPFDQQVARDLLQLPSDKKIIFFGSSLLNEPRKGMSYLVEALKELSVRTSHSNSAVRDEDIFLLVAGTQSRDVAQSLPFERKQVGYLRDDVTLALAYQAADLFVCPSIQDAGPMMIAESMLCGTPVVAFNAGGAPGWITSMETGYIASYKDSSDLAHGLYVLLSRESLIKMRLAAREAAVQRHEPSVVAAQYIALCRSLMHGSEAHSASTLALA